MDSRLRGNDDDGGGDNGNARNLSALRLYRCQPQKRDDLYWVTSNLMARVYQHREGVVEGFTSTYRAARLVWFEQHGTMETAILREKRIKRWLRPWKIALIEKENPDWRDLAVDFGFDPLPSSRIG